MTTSAYSTAVAALNGLVIAVMGDDAAGATTAADIGPNGYINVNYSAANVQGPALWSGAGSSSSTVGGTQWASKSVAGGQPLQITGAVTLGGWFQLNALTSKRPLGRNANWYIGVTSGGNAQFNLTNATSSGTRNVSNYNTIATGVPFFAVATWDGQETKLFVNGRFAASEIRSGGSIAPTTDALGFGSATAGSSQAIDGYWGGAFVANRALGAGQIKHLYDLSATLTLPSEGNFYDRRADATSTVIAAAPTASYCTSNLCGGTMTANEPSITDSSGNVYHPGCYGARSKHVTVTLVTGSSTRAAIAHEAKRVIVDNLSIYLRAVTASDINYLKSDGTLAFGLSPYFAVQQSACDVAYALALLAYTGGATRTDPTVAASKAVMEYVWANQTSGGTYDGAVFYTQLAGNNGVSFSLASAVFGTHLLASRGLIDPSTAARWVGNCVRMGNNCWTIQTPWYTNGNYKVNEAAGYYALYRLTGDPVWTTRYTYAQSFADSPPNPLTGYNNNSGLPFGFTSSVTPVLANGSDGQGYFSETDLSGAKSSLLDWDYLQYQIGALHRLLCFTGSSDTWVVNRLNQCVNESLNRVNTTTWVYDATGGSRHNLTTTYTTAAVAHLILNGLRGDLTATYPGSQWITGADVAYSRNGLRPTTSNEGYYQGQGQHLAGWITMASEMFTPPPVGWR